MQKVHVCRVRAGTGGEVLTAMQPASSEGHGTLQRCLSDIFETRLALGAQGCPAFVATDDVGRDEKWVLALLATLFPAACLAEETRVAQDIVHRWVLMILFNPGPGPIHCRCFLFVSRSYRSIRVWYACCHQQEVALGPQASHAPR